MRLAITLRGKLKKTTTNHNLKTNKQQTNKLKTKKKDKNKTHFFF